MNGLELSEQYFKEYGMPMIENKFPAYKERIAAGLAGEGSECFGLDDEWSRDHDWGPAFCLWLNREDYEKIGPALSEEYNRLPKEFSGYPARRENALSAGRVGVFSTGGFYQKFIGFDRPPETLGEWRLLPEEYLAVATNGKVFFDPLREFSGFRQKLLDFYPEDIRLKKLAARCMTAAQGGQYNYPRCIKRGEHVAAHCALTQFFGAACSMVYLLNKRYKPFYKWMHRMLLSLPLFGPECHALMVRLAANEGSAGDVGLNGQMEAIEQICSGIIRELGAQGLSGCESSFLLDHASHVQSRIQDPSIRSMHVMAE